MHCNIEVGLAPTSRGSKQNAAIWLDDGVVARHCCEFGRQVWRE